MREDYLERGEQRGPEFHPEELQHLEMKKQREEKLAREIEKEQPQ